MLFGRKNKKPKAGWDVPVQAEALTPLEEYQKRPGFNGNDVLQLAIDLCRALEAREKEGIPHGDVRPENIYITKDGVFQLGGAGTAVESVESAETAAGKAADAAYMAPEVWKGGPDSTTAGLYSLGLVLYQLLNGGRLPFWPEAPVPVTGQDRENAFARRMNGESFPVPTRAGGPWRGSSCGPVSMTGTNGIRARKKCAGIWSFFLPGGRNRRTGSSSSRIQMIRKRMAGKTGLNGKEMIPCPECGETGKVCRRSPGRRFRCAAVLPAAC